MGKFDKSISSLTGEIGIGPLSIEIPNLAEKIGSRFGDEGREIGQEIDRNTDDIKVRFEL